MITDAFTLVVFRGTAIANFSGKLANQLLVYALDIDDAGEIATGTLGTGYGICINSQTLGNL